MKHLSLYVIATLNADTPPPPTVSRPPRREKKRFRATAWLSRSEAPRLESREAVRQGFASS